MRDLPTSANRRGNRGIGKFPMIVGALTLVSGVCGFAMGFATPFVPVEGGANGAFGMGLKHDYFVHSVGSEQSGYNVAVTVNGHQLNSISSGGKTQDISDFVVKGHNKVLFEAKKLPPGMYDPHAWMDISLVQGKRMPDGGFSDGQNLLKYSRKAEDVGNFRDELEWETVDE